MDRKSFFLALPLACCVEFDRFLCKDIVETYIRGASRDQGLFNLKCMSRLDAQARIRFLLCIESLLIGSTVVSPVVTALCYDILLHWSFQRTLMDADSSVRCVSCSLVAKMFQDMSACEDTGRIANYFDKTLFILSSKLCA